MKKLTAILLTAVLLVNAIQPVCAAQTANQIEAAIPQAVDNLPSASKQDSQNLPSSEPPKEEIGESFRQIKQRKPPLQSQRRTSR